jgi:hypothetical protein
MLVDKQTQRGMKMSTTTKTKTLRLTNRANSPKLPKTTRRLADKAKAKVTPKAVSSEMLKETLAASIEQVPARPGLDGADQVPAASIGGLVAPVQISAHRAPKAKPAKVAKVKPVAKAKPKVDKPGAPKVDHTDTLLGLLSQPDRCTPREMMTATGLSHGALKATVGKLLHKKNLKIVLQRNPQPDPKDRKLTFYLYRVEPRA